MNCCKRRCNTSRFGRTWNHLDVTYVPNESVILNLISLSNFSIEEEWCHAFFCLILLIINPNLSCVCLVSRYSQNTGVVFHYCNLQTSKVPLKNQGEGTILFTSTGLFLCCYTVTASGDAVLWKHGRIYGVVLQVQTPEINALLL